MEKIRYQRFLEFMKKYPNKDTLSNILYSKDTVNTTTMELAQLLDLVFNGIKIIANKMVKNSTIITFDIKFYFVIDGVRYCGDSSKRPLKAFIFYSTWYYLQKLLVYDIEGNLAGINWPKKNLFIMV